MGHGQSKVVDKDKGWVGILEAARDLAKGASVKVGVLGDSDRGGLHLTDPETGEASDLTVTEIALVNEFGTEDGRIPARPAHRMTFDRRRDEIQNEAFRALVAIVLDRKIGVEDALNAMGMNHAASIKGTIIEGAGVPPPNAPSTALAKAKKGKTAKYFDAHALVGRDAKRALRQGGKGIGAAFGAVGVAAAISRNGHALSGMESLGLAIAQAAAVASARPLVDTGTTLNAISWAIQIGSDKGEARYR